MIVEVLCIGDELLDGRTREKNAYWLIQQLQKKGKRLSRVTVVGDDLDEIVSALKQAVTRSDCLLVSGGMGPTEDDLTREAASIWLDEPLVSDPDALQHLKNLHRTQNRQVTKHKEQQAYKPQGTEHLPTEVGSAAGIKAQRNGCTVFFIPGVPKEWIWFVQQYCLPQLFAESNEGYVCRKWGFFGVAESEISAKLTDYKWDGCSLHYQVSFPVVYLVAKIEGPESGNVAEEVERDILSLLGDNLISVDDETLVERLAAKLFKEGLTIAVAESCTGGQIGQELTSVSGASHYFLEDMVCYTNVSKTSRLGVQETTLEQYGAVSKETALEMAKGVRRVSSASIGVSTTGIAGPAGGSKSKPVGTVFLGFSIGEISFCRNLRLGSRSRDEIRRLTTWTVLATLLWYLSGRFDIEN
jgi:nicotinamide-nucleotide amidase